MASGMLFTLTFTKIGHLFLVNVDFLFERIIRRKVRTLVTSSWADSYRKFRITVALPEFCSVLMPVCEAGLETQNRAGR